MRGLRASVFAKLLVIMVTMAVLLLAAVTSFFAFLITPSLDTSFDNLFRDYARVVASQAPDFETAKRIAPQLDVAIRYEGPKGTWTTDRHLPSVADVRSRQIQHTNHFLPRREYTLAASPDGGTYLFAWSFGAHMLAAHMALLLVLLIIMAAVVLTAYVVLRHLLGPLRSLNAGVAQVGDGHLDVRIPTGPADEFGTLTAGFNEMVGRVRGMIQARDQLLVDVSHELRSPLTRMKVALEMLPPSERKASLAEDVAEMERMITELLELERLRTGRGVELSRQDLVPLIADIVASFGDRQPGVRVTSMPAELLANVDAGKLRIVLRNLLENALKYSLPDSRPVEISASRSGDRVTIRVKDDGVGIAAADAENVFEPFYRVDPSRTKSTGGYGLGLSICKRVMEAHGGSIAVEPHEGRGAVFVLTLRA